MFFKNTDDVSRSGITRFFPKRRSARAFLYFAAPEMFLQSNEKRGFVYIRKREPDFLHPLQLIRKESEHRYCRSEARDCKDGKNGHTNNKREITQARRIG